jgi:hypothetical protein
LVDIRDCSPENTAIVMVSPDYSATLAMHLAHGWSVNGEIINIIPVDVPYPDEDSKSYIQELIMKIDLFKQYENLILVEAGIIRGSNWEWIVKYLTSVFNFSRDKIKLVSLCENIHSKVKSDYVAEYYDDEKYELMFYFEKYNKHWPIK